MQVERSRGDTVQAIGLRDIHQECSKVTAKADQTNLLGRIDRALPTADLDGVWRLTGTRGADDAKALALSGGVQGAQLGRRKPDELPIQQGLLNVVMLGSGNDVGDAAGHSPSMAQ